MPVILTQKLVADPNCLPSYQ
uniref:Uncharacterized protein n=1 Tax=Arundo donax TaxID=35708 RepID=A0A0A9BXI7_ARUDO